MGTRGAAQQQTRIVLRPVASPLPLGFYAFGMGMFLTGAVDLGWVVPSVTLSVLLLTFVAPLEIASAVVAFLARDTLSGTGIGVFAASWVTSGVVGLVGAQGPSEALGLFQFFFTAVIIAVALVSFREKPMLGILLLIAAPRSTMTGVQQFFGIGEVATAAGAIGLLLAVVALYGGTSLLVEDLRGQPLFSAARRGPSEEAFTGGFDEQLQGIDTEAGVRRKL